MAQAPFSVADYLLTKLRQLSVTDIFQVPGDRFDTFDILPKWDYPALAQAYGAQGFRVTTIRELHAALQALQGITDRPALVEVVIPEKDLPRQIYRLGTE